MDNNINNSDDSSATGVRSRFNDKLKKILRDRLRWKKYGYIEENDKFNLKDAGRNALKVILAMPSVVYTHVVSKDEDYKNDENYREISIDEQVATRRIKVNKIRDIDVSGLKQEKRMSYKGMSKQTYVQNKDYLDNQVKISQLQRDILFLIKKRLVKNMNELELLQSELYILKEIDSNAVDYEKCKENIKEIKKLLSKIKSLKEKYDYLKENVDFEYMLEYNEDFLVDKILELKDLCTNADVKYIIDNYKLLEEYKQLYLKIDNLYDETIRLENVREQKVEALKERDIDFEKLKNEVYDIDRDTQRYNSFVKKQDFFLKDLEEKISKIDSYERVTYRLKGFNQLLGNSFKYLGLLMVNPLKGLIPGIVTQTLVTKNIVKNLYNNLEWEENKKTIYEAIDYSDTIRIAINDLDETAILLDSTLEDIVKLKNKYIREFSKYENDVYGYKDAIKKINKIENALLGSKIKMDLTRKKMKEKEKQNSDKMKRVKKMNSSPNN